jgi:hypothetical protein
MMSTPQEYWDACLIRTWRQSGSVLDAMIMFESITKIRMEDVEPKLLRIPRVGFPWKIGIKVFVAEHLSKISARLWDQPPEKDVALLKKLKDSKYDTEKDTILNTDFKNEIRKTLQNKKQMELLSKNISERNKATDWGTMKTPSRGRYK